MRIAISHARWIFCVIVACSVASSVHAAGDDRALTTATYVAEDYGFSGPDRLPSGAVTIRVLNRGKELHHLQFVKLTHGRSATDFNALLKRRGATIPPWALFSGGPNAPVPGGEAAATVNLTPGTYLLVCLIPDKTGTPHVALGMQKLVRVEGAEHAKRNAEEHDLFIDQVDFDFGFFGPIKAGPHTFHVRNHGTQPHEVLVVQLATGASVKDFVAYRPESMEPPPGVPVGGITGIGKGGEAFFSVNLSPGRYGLVCFFPDPITGVPHFTRGMMSEFMVRPVVRE
jgi:hypothetical protein